MAYGIRIDLPLPQAGQVSWDGPLNDILQEVIDVLASRVTVDGLDIRDTLDVQGSAIVDALRISFIPEGDPNTPNSVFYDDGELKCRDGLNRLVQLTSGGVVNVSGGSGFAGDYAATNSNGASYNNLTKTFTYTTDGGTSYAISETADLILHRGSGANTTRIRANDALGTSYVMTLPPGPPSATSVLRVDVTGGLTFAGSASFTESIDITLGKPASNYFVNYSYNESALINGLFMGPATSSIRIGYDFPIGYTLGDRIDGVAFGLAAPVGSTVTGTLYHQSDAGGTAVIARCAFDGNGTPGLRTMQAGTFTMTGTLPYLPPNTGSLRLRVMTAPQAGVGETLYTVQWIGTRKLIS